MSLRSAGVVIALTATLGFGCEDKVSDVKIGILQPLTGTAASSGAECKAGVELAAQIANEERLDINMTMAKNSGIRSLGGAKVKLVIKDHAGDADVSKVTQLVTELIEVDKVDIIISSWHSAVTREVAKICEAKGIPLFAGSSTTTDLTAQKYQWFWRTTPHDKLLVEDFFKFLEGIGNNKVKGISGVAKSSIRKLGATCESSSFGAGVCSLIGEFATKYDYDVVASERYDNAVKPLNLDTQAQKIIDSGASTLLFASYDTDAILAMQTLKTKGAKPTIVWGNNAGFESLGFADTLKDTTIGILTRAVFLPTVTTKKKIAEQINTLYKTKTGQDLSGASAREFTVVQSVIGVIEKAGSVNPQAIQAAANTVYIPPEELIVPWAGIKFSSAEEDKGQNILGTGLIAQYQKNLSGAIVKEIIYPFDLATSDAIYPFKGFD